MIIETNSASETLALGEKLGKAAKPGQIYTLNGDLGVGKTVLTQGFAKGLGITEAVNSPTFTIIQEYTEGRLPFYHFDVYRIGDIEEMEEIGYDDYFFGEGVCLIEWAELIEELIPEGGIKEKNPECGGKTKGNRKDSCFRQTAKMSCTGRKYRKGNKKL